LVELPVSSLVEDTVAAEVAAAGGNAALFTMKAENGHLAYVSAEGWANYAKVTETDVTINKLIATCLSVNNDLYAVARVCCFKDDDTPYYYGRSNGLRDGNGNWRDETGSRWFSPASQGARDYIIGICREVADLGFDEIWLDYCFFPADGRTDRILRGDAYNDDTLTGDLEEFYRQLREALADDYPELKISMTVAPDLRKGLVSLSSGQSWELLGAYADLVYMGPGEIAPEDPFFPPGGEASRWFSYEDVVWFGRENPPENAGRVLP
ncbi:MAG: putative glycoside hydrolase, partial [Oscillospiraceae bacterium]|nr:putative glycoside hydrolase [Oscillospiraceae bacterium]